MRKRGIYIISFLLFTAAFFAGCTEKKKSAVAMDAPGKGTIEISADESFAPVIREQIAMYEASYPGSKINVHFKSEADCLKDLFKDSATRLVIVTRALSAREEKVMGDSMGYSPRSRMVASDAIALVVNINSNDTLFDMQRLQAQLTGKLKKEQTIVFDGLNKTSTVRFVEDSILKGQHFDTSIVRAVSSSSEVLDYVASHENALGFVGINRIGNPEDTAQLRMLKKVKMAYMKCDVCVNTPYVYPSQQSILNHRYPLVRGLYYIIKENYTGLGSDFVAFLTYERGQLIFRRAYLGPSMEFRIRNVRINEELPKN